MMIMDEWSFMQEKKRTSSTIHLPPGVEDDRRASDGIAELAEPLTGLRSIQKKQSVDIVGPLWGWEGGGVMALDGVGTSQPDHVYTVRIRWNKDLVFKASYFTVNEALGLVLFWRFLGGGMCGAVAAKEVMWIQEDEEAK